MKLYIDESGNTGQPLRKNGKFNFTDQPYYVLTGIILNDEQKIKLEKFIKSQITKHHIQGNELKSNYIYNSKSEFLSELIDYIISNKLPFFIELMDKKFYIQIHIIEYFIVPYYAFEINNEILEAKRVAASNLGRFLNEKIYDDFLLTVQEYSNESLEKFYDTLIDHFDKENEQELRKNVENTKADYYDFKQEEGSNEALLRFLPLPDENSKQRLTHILPNYSAFTNLIARANKYSQGRDEHSFSIIHDEQKQFDVIFEESLKALKNVEIDKLIESTYVSENSKYQIDKNMKLDFIDSKLDLSIQVTDLIAGFIMRFWFDFKKHDEDNINRYKSMFKKLHYPEEGESLGINYVIPIHDHFEILQEVK